MQKLLKELKVLQSGEIGGVISKRIKEFERVGKAESPDIFKELCFCLLTANYTAEGGIRIQKAIGDGFLDFPKAKLAKTLKKLGHRFPNARAGYISEARKYKGNIGEILTGFESEAEAREWLVKNIKGLGYKEASHFLRNIGYKNLAIVDFHIVDLLERHKLSERHKTLTKSRYLDTESVLGKISKKAVLSLAELDLYLWYMETGKILK